MIFLKKRRFKTKAWNELMTAILIKKGTWTERVCDSTRLFEYKMQNIHVTINKIKMMRFHFLLKSHFFSLCFLSFIECIKMICETLSDEHASTHTHKTNYKLFQFYTEKTLILYTLRKKMRKFDLLILCVSFSFCVIERMTDICLTRTHNLFLIFWWFL